MSRDKKAELMMMSLTRNAQMVLDADDDCSSGGLTGASFWGFLRSARLEAPRVKLHALDLSAEAAVEEDIVVACCLVGLPNG